MYELETNKVEKVMTFLTNPRVYKEVTTEEGDVVIAFNKEISEKFITPKLTKEKLEELGEHLRSKGTLNINVMPNGYVSAATRDTVGDDETNYDAVWVRDSAWIYEGLRAQGRHDEAKRVILGLWDYYATEAQRNRIKEIIKDPSLAEDPMKCPHIRFDASSPTLDDVFVEENGKKVRQGWNHKQNDAHGLFLLGLSDACARYDFTPEDITEDRAEAFSLLFEFFKVTGYETFKESGAWEEVDAVRASSVGLVANAHYRWHENFKHSSEFFSVLLNKINALPKSSRSCIDELLDGYQRGLAVTKAHLDAGGESPFYPEGHTLRRTADSALLHLLTPYRLEGLEEKDVEKILSLVTSLERPAGILRYENDSYQSMGYVWLKDGQLLHGTSEENFESRGKLFDQFGKGTEPHWFFDSMLACVYLDLAKKDPKNTDRYTALAIRAVKRQLGQITGTHTDLKPITAEGEIVRDNLLPESINVVLKDGHQNFLTSMIVPLNWPVSSLSLALEKLGEQLS